MAAGNPRTRLLLLAAVIALAPATVVTAQPPLSFDVASVKPFIPQAGMYVTGTGGTIRISGNRVNILGSITGLVMSAYNLREFQVSAAPHWTDSRGQQQDYEISAVAEGKTLTVDEARRMLQTLLADRFRLKLHRETKKLPVYDLVVLKNEPTFKEHVGDIPPPELAQFSGQSVKFKFVGRPMQDLVGILGSNVDRPVLDKTELKATYDFTLEFSRSNPDLVRNDGPEADRSVFSSVQRQLGLKLNPANEPVETIVIDSAERPSEN